MARKIRVRRKKPWLRKTFVMLGFRADQLDPAEITAALRVKPTLPEDAVAKDDTLLTRTGEHSPWTGIWRWRTDFLRSNEVDDHLRALLKALESRRKAALRIRSRRGYRSWLWIHWIQKYDVETLGIDSRLLAKVAMFVRTVRITMRYKKESAEPDRIELNL
jgi:hypothetical protein